jgi:hypothetical protein
MTNPLIDKFYELHPEKKEKPKPQKTHTERLIELRDTSTIPITKLTSYDNESLNDSFLQIAEKVKNKQAQIYSMNMDIDQQTRTQRITFEVWDTF